MLCHGGRRVLRRGISVPKWSKTFNKNMLCCLLASLNRGVPWKISRSTLPHLTCAHLCGKSWSEANISIYIMLIEKLSTYLDRSNVATNQKCCHIQFWGQSNIFNTSGQIYKLISQSPLDQSCITTPSCCVFWLVNGCSTRHLLVKIIFLMLKQVFPYINITHHRHFTLVYLLGDN